MRIRSKAIGLAIALAVLVAHPITAQQNGSTRVQHDPTMLNACTSANSTLAVANQVTLTIAAPPSGQYVYICGIDMTVSFNTGGPTVGTNVTYTSTNFGGWQWKTSYAGAASTTFTQVFQFALPVKAPAPGTAVTFVSPASNATGAYSLNAYYYYAP